MMSNLINIERDVVYYHYWLLRCQIEPEDSTLDARKLIYEADRAFTAAQLVKASELYDEGMKKWRQVLDAYPACSESRARPIRWWTRSITIAACCTSWTKSSPARSVLQDVLEADATFRGLPLPEGEEGSEAATSGDPKASS